ncbi:MAG: glycerol kinase GlpK [Hyphomonadaceae bacterium]|jgi:glycerol kinase|nr:glycerol kinase GlpK [Hyphomonadaceae bacterium]
MTDTILVLDEGTSSTRAALYDRDLQRGRFCQLEVPLVSPAPDVVEQDASLIWASTRDMALAAADGRVPQAIAITNQRETTIVWDRATGEPVAPAMVWQDRRGADLCAAMRADGRETVLTARTGLLADPYFSGFKLAWMLSSIEGLRAQAEAGKLAFGTVDCWLIWNLTGGAVHATDASNASRTGLYDIHTGDWSDELLAVFDIPRALLPEVRDTVGSFGETSLFGTPVPISGVVGDQQAALLGQGCVAPGQTKVTYGTGAFLMSQTGSRAIASTSRMLTTVAWRIKGQTSYAVEGAILNAGTAVQWLRDGLGLFVRADETGGIAASVPDSAGVRLVPAFTGLGAPHWCPGARGLISGIGRGTTKAHLVRAALEASAFQTADLLAALAQDGIDLAVLRVDGGMVANDVFLQALADFTTLPVERPADLEMTARGAANAAALALGWTDLETLGAPSVSATRLAPVMAADVRERELADWRAAVAAAIGMG